MNLVYVGAAVVAGLLIGFITLAIVWMTARVSRNIRKKAVDLISAYDEIIEKKSKQLEELEDKIAEREERKDAEDPGLPAPAVLSEEAEAGDGSANAVLRMTERFAGTRYREETAVDLYSEIKENFRQDPAKVIRQIPAAMKPGSVMESEAEKLLRELDFETVFTLSTLPVSDQYTILREALDSSGKELLDAYAAEAGGFSAGEFYGWLKTQAADKEETVKLYVSPADKDRWDVPGRVEIIPDDAIVEGFQVTTCGKLYDYSIKRKEVT